MSFCSRFMDSNFMKYVYLGAGATASAASYVGVNYCLDAAMLAGKIFSQACPNDPFNGLYSSEYCSDLNTRMLFWLFGGNFLYAPASLGTTAVIYSIWRSMPIRAIEPEEGIQLVESEVAKRKVTPVKTGGCLPSTWIAFGIGSVGFLTQFMLSLSGRNAAMAAGTCIAKHNATLIGCEALEQARIAYSIANNVIGASIGALWTGIGTWALLRSRNICCQKTRVF